MKSKRLLRILGIALLGATTLSTISPKVANAAWMQNNTGWWYTEGSSWSVGWRQIDGVWYYFDANGYMKTRWVQDNGVWYYMDNSGAMKTGWINDNGVWYYLDKSGAMQTGWLDDNGTWYYLDKSGAMKTDWVKYNFKWYYLEGSGAMKTGWLNDNGTLYYLKSNGAMAIGWENIDNDKYYFTTSGEAAKGRYYTDEHWYYFRKDSGKLLINGTEDDFITDSQGVIIRDASYEVKTVSGKKYLYKNGMMQKDGWITVRFDNKYYADKDGVLFSGRQEIDGVTYYFALDTCELQYFESIKHGLITDGDGRLLGSETVDGKTYFYDAGKKVTGLYKQMGIIEDKYYYFNKDGVMQKDGWITDEKGDKYYADKDGKLYEGAQKIDGKLYYFNDAVLDTTPGLTSRTSESIDITTGLNNYYYSYINQDGSLFVGLKTVNDKTYFFNEEGKSVPGIQKAENGKNYYFNQMTDELKGNIDCYGYSVNDKGEVTKINYETMKNDILKNDSKRLNELENQYGKLTIKNTSFNTFEREVEMYCDISKNDLNSDDRYIDRNEEVFVFEVSADVEGQEKLVNRYCVRAKSGEIYIYDNSKRQASFKEIKDNKIVNEYDAVPIC